MGRNYNLRQKTRNSKNEKDHLNGAPENAGHGLLRLSNEKPIVQLTNI